MSFYEKYISYRDFDFDGFFKSVTKEDVLRVINKEKTEELDFLHLLSPAGEEIVENIAQRARGLSLHHFGINISTRERAEFRNRLIQLGVTKMSAGVSTEVGGHAQSNKGNAQFEISDSRSVDEMKEAIKNMGYQPILKDWFKI